MGLTFQTKFRPGDRVKVAGCEAGMITSMDVHIGVHNDSSFAVCVMCNVTFPSTVGTVTRTFDQDRLMLADDGG